MIELKNGRVSLALHAHVHEHVRGAPLLLLHELGGSAADFYALDLAWAGPVYGLDLSGHGSSGRVHGGGYYPEMWAADADAALAFIIERHGADERAVLLGRGLGAFIALLLAGARSERARTAILCDGRGLFGSEDDPTARGIAPPDVETREHARGLQATPATDPNVYEAQEELVRPAPYAARFARSARQLLLIEDDNPRPSWWRAVAEEPQSVRCGALADALRLARTS